jgi:type VI secretion system protein ImpH
MAGQIGAAPSRLDLQDALEREPWAFDFFQALRRLEAEHADKPLLGRSRRPSEDAIRLGQEPSLAFAPSTIAAFDRSPGRPPRLSVHVLGLLGPNGPMPLHLTEYVRGRSRTFGDMALARFLDVFHHRLLSLFHRAWASSRPTVHFDRPGSDRFGVWIGAMFGQGAPAFSNRDEIPDLAKRHYAGRLSLQTRNAEGLEAIVEDLFGVPARVVPFRGTWLDIPPDARWLLGTSRDGGELGVSTTTGARLWDRAQSFRLALGPLTLDDYERFLPGGPVLRRLAALVANYLGDELDWDVNLILDRRAVPQFPLGGTARLGTTTWLSCRTPERDPADVILRPAARG